MTSQELIQNKASPKTVMRQASKEKELGVISKEEYQLIKKEVSSQDYQNWLDERFVE